MDRLSDYDYHLPAGAIAQDPLEDRSRSRLLVLDKSSGAIEHRRFYEVPDLLRPGDLLIVNDTRVTALRLEGRKETGGAIEALLLKEDRPGEFVALAKPGRRLQPGTRLIFGDLRGEIAANLLEGQKLIRFEPHSDLATRLQELGSVPLPPYITQKLDKPERYQTVYGATAGSAAAPTAGLHFTSELLDALARKGIQMAKVTLDVGLDTFRPLQAENLDDHRMHGEKCMVPPETAEAIAACRGRIIAVGTTAVRTLESMAVGPRHVQSGARTTTLFIRPGFRFQIIDGMFTNFHMPRTTMLLMISALAGSKAVFAAYDEALKNGYRFLSFGDAMLIF